MQNEMNMKNKTHKCVPRNSRINLSAQEKEKALPNKNNCLYKDLSRFVFCFFCVPDILPSFFGG